MQLKEWLKRQRISQLVFAELIGVDRATVSLWLTNKRHPTHANYLKIKEVTNGKVKYDEIC